MGLLQCSNRSMKRCLNSKHWTFTCFKISDNSKLNLCLIKTVDSCQLTNSVRTVSSFAFDKKYKYQNQFRKLEMPQILKVVPVNVTNSNSGVFSSSCLKSLHSRSGIHTTEDSSVQNTFSTENLVEICLNEVKPFGTLSIQSIPFDVIVQPLDPLHCPDGNKSIVEMFYTGSGNLLDETPNAEGQLRASETGLWRLAELSKVCSLNVKVSEHRDRLEVSCGLLSGVVLPLVIVVSIPIKFNVEVTGGKSNNVTISHLECENVLVSMDSGNCILAGLKTATTNIHCADGNITCSKQLLGSIRLCCGKHGSITGDRFQGTHILCTTEHGNINIKTVYAVETMCTSQSGEVSLRDIHGDTAVISDTGNLTVGSLDGKLKAKLSSGSADVYLSRPDGVDITTTTGDVTLRLSQDCTCRFELNASKIETDDSLKAVFDQHGPGSSEGPPAAVIKASAKQGRISLKAHDWLSSLNLHFGKESS